MEKMTQLPNGDMYIARPRGHERPDTVQALVQNPIQDPVKNAIEKALNDPQRPGIECIWCGQSHFADEATFTQHVKDQHSNLFGESAEKARKDQEQRVTQQRFAAKDAQNKERERGK